MPIPNENAATSEKWLRMISGKSIARWSCAIGLIAASLCAARVLAAAPTPRSTPFPGVAPLPTPSLPAIIRQVSPLGSVDTLAQIRIRFSEPIVRLEAIESPDERRKLRFFHITPQVPGRFHFITPHVVGFQLDRELPLATRFRVTVDKGLSMVSGRRLGKAVSYTFEMPEISISLPQGDHFTLTPDLELFSNVQLNLATLATRLRMTAESGQLVPTSISLKSEGYRWSPVPQGTNAVPDYQQWKYRIALAAPLRKATTYRFALAPGVAGVWSNIPAGDFSSWIETYQPLRFGGVVQDPYGDRLFQGGTPVLVFNNAVTDDSARRDIRVKGVGLHPPLVSQGGDNISLPANLFQPDTAYAAQLDPGLTDIFGQQLGQPTSAGFRIGAYSPDIWAPTDFHIIAVHSDLSLRMAVIDLDPHVYLGAFRRLAATDLVYVDSAAPSESDPRQLFGPSVLPLVQNWQAYAAPYIRDKPVEVDLGLRHLLGSPFGLLAYGLQAQTYPYLGEHGEVRHARPTFYGMLQLTDLGVFAEIMPRGAVILINQLSDGRPVEGVSVAIHLRHLNARERPAPHACADAVTDASGALILSPQQLSPCLGAAGSDAPTLLVVARHGDDWAFATPGFPSRWDNDRVDTRSALFTDRGLYQPGETVSLSGAAYFWRNDRMRRDAGGSYHLSLTNPNGAVTKLGQRTADRFGLFELQFPLARNQRPGYYTLTASSTNGNAFSSVIQVAEFKPPAFALDLRLDKPVAAAGETEQASATAKYLFGSPLSGSRVRWFVTRNRWYPRWSDWLRQWQGYSFGKLWMDPEREPALEQQVSNRTARFDQAGGAQLAVTLDPVLPFWMTYSVEAEASDAANRTVAQTRAFNVLPAPEVIGINGPQLVVAGSQSSFDIVVTDRNAHALAGRTVFVALEKQQVSTQHVVTYQPADSVTVVSAAQPVTARLKAGAEGVYRVRADSANAKTNAAETDRAVSVVSELPTTPTPAPSGEPAFTIDYSPQRPKPGDSETVTVSLPYDDADVFAAVVRQGMFQRFRMHALGGSVHFTFNVTAAMAPDVIIQAQAVRLSAPKNGLAAGPVGQTLSANTSVVLPIDVDDRKLQARVRALHRSLEPGARQTLQLRLRDVNGKPVAGEFAVAVVDRALVQLSRYQPPNLFDTVWGNWVYSSAMTGDNRAAVWLQPSKQQLLARFGFGQPSPGNRLGQVVPQAAYDTYNVNVANSISSMKVLGRVSTAAAVGNLAPPVIRKNFSVLGYFNGAVRTNSQGDATVSFQVPDSLTAWQVYAEAVSAPEADGVDGVIRFGAAQTTFLTHKRLALNPLLPQFARPGDRLSVGMNVTNDTGRPGRLSVQGVLRGPLDFVQGRTLTQLLRFSTAVASGTTGHRFPAQSTGWGTASVQFAGWLNGTSDAFQLPVSVLPLEVTEHVVETGTTIASSTIPLHVDPHVDRRVGGLKITLASTLLPEITVPATQVFSDVDIPLLEPSASRLLIAADLRLLTRSFKRPVIGYDPTSIARLQLDHLLELQNSDGGFSYWPQSDYSDPWDSAYAAEALGKAVTSGLAVDPAMIAGVQRYLDDVVDNPRNYCPLCLPETVQRLRLEAMLGLQAIGEQRAKTLNEVYALRDDFGLITQVKLARMLSVVPGWQLLARALTAKVQQYVYESGRNATVNVPQGWWWFDSVTSVQSQMLRLFVAQRIDAEILDRLVRGLLGRERNGAWRNHYDSAQAIEALVAYAQLEPVPPNFRATARVSKTTVANTAFAGYARTSDEVTVPMAQLPPNRSDVVLSKTGTGRLHYVVEYGYRFQGAQFGRVSGLRIQRLVHVANGGEQVANVALAPPRSPALLVLGQVFDISLRVTADHPVDHVIVTDPLPAGLEAVDQSFSTTTHHYEPQFSGWFFNYQTIYRDRVVLYADQLGPGVYDVHYLARSVTPGTFLWPGADVYLIYAPEEFGRTASSTLVISGM